MNAQYNHLRLSKKNWTLLRPFLYALIVLVSVIAAPISFSRPAHGVTQNPAPTAKISFTFDDGFASALTQAQPTLAKYGLTGTSYVITNCIGMTTVPNACRADSGVRYMTWPQVKQLQNAGWEIGSHTHSHPYLASSDASDGQPNILTPAQVSQELSQSKTTLAAQGIAATAFATPYGDYTSATLAQIAKLYTSHRGFADQNVNNWPHNDYLLNVMQVQEGVSVAQVKAKIDAAIANKQWLVLALHEIRPRPSTNPDDYQYATAKLDRIAAYVKNRQNAGLIAPVNVSKGLATSDVNLLANGSFDAGVASGWTTDAPATITKDTASNGSAPSPANSIRLTSAATTSHLFSPKVAVDPSASYLIKSYLSVSALSSGEVGFYIDEYSSSGDWISGQYKIGERSAFTEQLNFAYKPTSANVRTANLQVIVTGNSGITAYLDNVQWFATTAVNLPAPSPAPANLVANGALDSGISGGWSTDSPTNITSDAGSHGSPNNVVNSVAIKSAATTGHLFSPKVAIDATKTYTLTNYLNLQTLTGGEVGFYVDEYDAAGGWISGRYVAAVRNASTGDVTFTYTPSSANVKSASLQVIVTANSGAIGYYDDLRWYMN